MDLNGIGAPVFAVGVLLLLLFIRRPLRRFRRRRSLKQLEDGSFTWRDLRGNMTRSAEYPAKPGGPWDQEDGAEIGLPQQAIVNRRLQRTNRRLQRWYGRW